MAAVSCCLVLDALENFFAMDGNALGGIHADTHLVSLDAQYGDGHFLTDHDGFPDSSRKNQHDGQRSFVQVRAHHATARILQKSEKPLTGPAIETMRQEIFRRTHGTTLANAPASAAGIGATGLREIRTTAALAADLRRHCTRRSRRPSARDVRSA